MSNAAVQWQRPWCLSGEAVLLARRVLRQCGNDEERALLDLPHWARQRGHELGELDAAVLVMVAAEQEDTLALAGLLAAAQPERAGRRAA
jgi:malonyl CoA-acyl carrier protein transacylase